MTLFFPDLNVWVALSVAAHSHNARAWRWLDSLPLGTRLVFSRYTQIGLLRLLTNESVMGEQTLTLRRAWAVYDQWVEDMRVEFYPETAGLDAIFRETTRPVTAKAASKWVGDCYLLAYARHIHAALVTFDAALHRFALTHHHAAVIPA
jgi:toxin-antitoxin system PIN domain toxin